ncbi:MAG: amidohydrolase family protein [Dehalococcoidia bacterium]
MIIDFHVHHYPEKYLEALCSPGSAVQTYRRDDGRLVARWLGGIALTVPDPLPDANQRLRLMDELGIDMQVLSVPSPSVYFRSGRQALDLARNVNDALAEFPGRYPHRFQALAALPLTDPDLALLELDRALNVLSM